MTKHNSYDMNSLFIGKHHDKVQNTKTFKILIPLAQSSINTLNRMMRKNKSLGKDESLTWFVDLSQIRYYAETPEEHYEFNSVTNVSPLEQFANKHGILIHGKDNVVDSLTAKHNNQITIYELAMLEMEINNLIKQIEESQM